MASKPVMIEADKLTKVYGDYTAVNNLSFSCHKGEIVGFLGPNGAGKTTTMRMLTGYMPPTTGTAYIAGFHTVDDSLKAREHLGYLPETVPLYPEMRVEEYLAFIGQLRRVPNVWKRIDEVLEAVDLLDRAESYINTLSKGMRQRVGLAQALLHNPAVLILDEPTIGLDPRQIADVRQLIKKLGEQHTILLSTHILSEVEQLCSRVMMVINGQIRADLSMRELQSGKQLNVVVGKAPAEVPAKLQEVSGVQQVKKMGDKEFALTFDGRDETKSRVAELVTTAGWGLLELYAERMSLETIFLNKLREAEVAPEPETSNP